MPPGNEALGGAGHEAMVGAGRRADKPRGGNTVVSARNDLQGVMRWQG